MEPYEQAMHEWARAYNAYARLSGDPGRLWRFYGPFSQEVRDTGEIPEWMGVDLLRGWAFAMWRAHDKGSGLQTLFEEFPEFELVADAVRNHPEAKPEDLPPAR